jgi:uncharacterized membrane protein
MSVLLARQMLEDAEIPRSLSLRNLTPEIWPNGEVVPLIIRVDADDIPRRDGEVRVQSTDGVVSHVVGRFVSNGVFAKSASGELYRERIESEIPAHVGDFMFEVWLTDGRLKLVFAISEGNRLAIASVVLVSRADDAGTGRDGLGLAVVAGLSIGTFDVVLAQISDGSVFGPLTVVRATEGLVIVGVVVLTRAAWRPPGALVPGIVGVGAADMAGNAGFILAVQTGALAIASVLSSLYPVTTVILATIFLREPVTRSHAFGIALAAAAIVLIGVGST